MTRKVLCIGGTAAGSAAIELAKREREWTASGNEPSLPPVTIVVDARPVAAPSVEVEYAEWASQWTATAEEARAAMKRRQRKLGPFRFEASEAAKRAVHTYTQQREVARKARRARGKAAKSARRRNR